MIMIINEKLLFAPSIPYNFIIEWTTTNSVPPVVILSPPILVDAAGTKQ